MDHLGNIYVETKDWASMAKRPRSPAEIARHIRRSRETPHIISTPIRRELRELVEAARREPWPSREPRAWARGGCELPSPTAVYLAYVRNAQTRLYEPFPIYAERGRRWAHSGEYEALLLFRRMRRQGFGPARCKLVYWMRETETYFEPPTK
jgi:hypothetical protein